MQCADIFSHQLAWHCERLPNKAGDETIGSKISTHNVYTYTYISAFIHVAECTWGVEFPHPTVHNLLPKCGMLPQILSASVYVRFVSSRSFRLLVRIWKAFSVALVLLGLAIQYIVPMDIDNPTAQLASDQDPEDSHMEIETVDFGGDDTIRVFRPPQPAGTLALPGKYEDGIFHISYYNV